MESPRLIPWHPQTLELSVARRFDGAPWPNPRQHGAVTLAASDAGLWVEAALPHQASPRIPAAPTGARVPDLYEYDVVECFLVGGGGEYTEVELGAGGHYLVLRFTAPRVRRAGDDELPLDVAFEAGPERWTARACLPWSHVPTPLRAVNAFVIAGGGFLAHAPVPGETPDFHQPDCYPAAALIPWPSPG
ncbi:MAG: hypothetical protein MJE66_17005 [Proteobacteria bacterium]|nr:hypothetical protein [Pseudomonadota bacterium]